MDDTEHDPWAAPPDWVHLPDVPGWIERRLGFPGLPLVPRLISALRAGLELTYRIGGTSRALDGYNPRYGYKLPPGMGVRESGYVSSKRVIVDNWEKAEPDWRTGTVAGWKLDDGTRSRLPIEVYWLALERWAPPRARDLAAAARKAAALAIDAVPPGLNSITSPLQTPKAARRGGRSYAKQDAPLVQKMRELVLSGEADPWPAAVLVADRAEGKNTSIQSRAKRLLQRYSEAFSPEQT